MRDVRSATLIPVSVVLPLALDLITTRQPLPTAGNSTATCSKQSSTAASTEFDLAVSMMSDKSTRNHLLKRWLKAQWLRPIYQAAALIAAVVLSIFLVGLAQRQGWIQTVAVNSAPATAAAESAVQYICPMMCTPPLSEPGRCPVCGMELVPSTASTADGDDKSVTISAADRRLIGIKTATVRRIAAERTIRGVGRLVIDESQVTRIPANAGGRVESLAVNFVGQPVAADQPLATLYSPDLYAAQTELLTLKRTRLGSAGRKYSLAIVRDELVASAENDCLNWA